jgi:hypothetical protein
MDDLLRIELRVLLLRHGRRNVIEALASVGNQTPEEIEAELNLAEKRKASRKQKITLPVDIAAELSRDKPESAEMLRTLATRYENRAFLPQLRDVKRFLDRAGSPHGRLKSRRAAARQVMTVLCQISTEELKRLVASPEAHEDSDFALLAREIMGSRSPGRER